MRPLLDPTVRGGVEGAIATTVASQAIGPVNVALRGTRARVPASQASPGANAHPGTTPIGSATVATITADEWDGFWKAPIEEAAHAQPVHAEPSPRRGPGTLDADVHAQVMGIDAQTSSTEPDLLVGQPGGPNQGGDTHLANAYSEDLMYALGDWLVEVEEVEVEAVNETARVKEGAGPRVDLQAFGAPFHPKLSQLPTRRYHMCHTKDGQLGAAAEQCIPAQ